ncbi:large ribosomal subunit protein P2-like [Meriones unguiculatus]|uniref:large ribosomal subunit protein P2-like n=1 Tax=Meriones unguiculatus TaxID=10047 RepID=UPI00293EE702|nr:large ribosomal subunit protein P2-like [Meriones unguiculatus]
MLPAAHHEDNSSPSMEDIKKILDSEGLEEEDDRLNKVISELNGGNTEDIIAHGVGELTRVPVDVAWAISAAPGSATPAAGSAQPPLHTPLYTTAEERKKMESEALDDGMVLGLFD